MPHENLERALRIVMGGPGLRGTSELWETVRTVMISLLGRSEYASTNPSLSRLPVSEVSIFRPSESHGLGIAQSLLTGTPTSGGRGLLSALVPALRFLGGGERQINENRLPIPFSMPDAIRLQTAAGVHNPYTGVDYDQRGTPRVVEASSGQMTPNITVQVSAMDSRSFIERSDEIAKALKDALLHSHAVADVLTER